MKRAKKIFITFMIVVLATTTYISSYGKDVGQDLDNLTDIPVIKVTDIQRPLEANVDSNSFVFRY